MNLTLEGAESADGMPRYSEAFKAKVVEKMMPPDARTVADVHRETGISEPTLYAWRRQFQNRGEAVPADPGNPESWSGRDKLAVVIETAALNEQALSEYCRRKGLYPEQIERWKDAAMAGSADPQRLTRDERTAWQQEKTRVRDLERELRRKEKALAEAAALLVLKKKARAIWGDDEDA